MASPTGTHHLTHCSKLLLTLRDWRKSISATISGTKSKHKAISLLGFSITDAGLNQLFLTIRKSPLIKTLTHIGLSNTNLTQESGFKLSSIVKDSEVNYREVLIFSQFPTCVNSNILVYLFSFRCRVLTYQTTRLVLLVLWRYCRQLKKYRGWG